MNTRDIQELLAHFGWYTGALDGVAGPLTRSAVAAAWKAHSARFPKAASEWTDDRRAIAAGQAVLAHLGFEPGPVDGLVGHNTLNALAAWRHKQATGERLKMSRPAVKAYAPITGEALPRQSECDAVYGRPGDEIRARLVTVPLPFPMRLDWALDQVVTKVTLHRAGAVAYVNALEGVRDHYGLDRLRALGIDRYAGGYNHRKMRGGSRWSMHAYGIAVDHFAAPNGLSTPCPEALFCRPEYKAFLDIMEGHGWLPAIRLWGADAMHFQAARMG